MQLVPTKINSEFGHLGGVGEINAGAFKPGGLLINKKRRYKMPINDPIFGELEYEYGWVKDTIIRFLEKESEISLVIDGEEDGEFDEQYMIYQALMQNWEDLQPKLLQSILDYYKQKRHELGYDIELNEKLPIN